MARTLVRILLLAVAATLFAGGQTDKASAGKAALRIYVGEYTPRERAASDRWDPPKYMNRIIADYSARHPGVSFEVLPEIPAGDAYETWVVTQFKANKAPDLGVHLFSEVNRHYTKGWYVDLRPWLDKPNPYVAGNKAWRDVFVPGVVSTGTAPDGGVYVLPTTLTGTAIFYNKEIFKQAGVSVPETWAQFIEIQKKIKAAGYIPFAFHMSGNPYQANWALRSMQDMLLDSRLAVIKGGAKPERNMIEGSGVSQKELVAAIARGDYDARDKQWLEQLRLLRVWADYWDPGWLAMNVDDAQRQFVTGKAAMFWHSSSKVKPIKSDSLRKFDYGTFGFPTITRESSQYATGVPAPAIGGFTGGGHFFVSADTRARGTTDAAVDFLMFLTAPQNIGPLNNDLGAYAPGVKDMGTLDPDIQPFLQSAQKGVFRIESFYRGLTRQYSDQFVKVLEQYLTDRITLDRTGEEIEKLLIDTARTMIEDNKWTDIKKP
jgi:raffinose/stachyose/melibiose transport system substrate-binding protein